CGRAVRGAWARGPPERRPQPLDVGVAHRHYRHLVVAEGGAEHGDARRAEPDDAESDAQRICPPAPRVPRFPVRQTGPSAAASTVSATAACVPSANRTSMSTTTTDPAGIGRPD